jgi:hypothetical protein
MTVPQTVIWCESIHIPCVPYLDLGCRFRLVPLITAAVENLLFQEQLDVLIAVNVNIQR